MFDTIEFASWDADKIDEYSNELKTIFKYNEDIDKTAYLNWRMDFSSNPRRQFVIIGEAYFATAYHLIKECLENNLDKKADIWIFPIMFNIVHGIEVYLKAINANLNVVMGKNATDIKLGHDIKRLYDTAESLLLEYKNINNNSTKDQMYTAIKVVGNFVSNIYDKTKDMTFARYPITNKKEEHFYVQSLENEVVDMEELEEQVVIIYKLLDLIYDMPELEMELQCDMMADFYNEYY